jgi:hypothetical protein
LHRFHTFKDVFLLGQASKKDQVKANALRMELVKKRKIGKDTNDETWMRAKKRQELNTWRD